MTKIFDCETSDFFMFFCRLMIVDFLTRLLKTSTNNQDCYPVKNSYLMCRLMQWRSSVATEGRFLLTLLAELTCSHLLLVEYYFHLFEVSIPD